MQLPKDPGDILWIMGPEHMASFSYPFLLQNPLLILPALQKSVQKYLSYFRKLQGPLALLLDVLPFSLLFHIGSTTWLLFLR